MEVLSLLLSDLGTLARFEGTAVPLHQPTANPDPITSLLLSARPHFSFLQLRDALLQTFTVRGDVLVDPVKLLAGAFGLNCIVVAFYRLLRISEEAEVTELRGWLESLVYATLIQSCVLSPLILGLEIGTDRIRSDLKLEVPNRERSHTLLCSTFPQRRQESLGRSPSVRRRISSLLRLLTSSISFAGIPI